MRGDSVGVVDSMEEEEGMQWRKNRRGEIWSVRGDTMEERKP